MARNSPDRRSGPQVFAEMPRWAGGPRPRRQWRGLPPRVLFGIGVAVVAGGAGWLSSADAPPPPPATIEGRAAFVVDGDTLEISPHRIRLLGLDALEAGQTCTRADGATWPCGTMATRRLEELALGRPLVCTTAGTDSYDRVLATCRTGEIDIGERLVAAGLAISANSYTRAEAEAKSVRAGIWDGSFVRPAEWRRGQPEDPVRRSRFQQIADWVAGWLSG